MFYVYVLCLLLHFFYYIKNIILKYKMEIAKQKKLPDQGKRTLDHSLPNQTYCGGRSTKNKVIKTLLTINISDY